MLLVRDAAHLARPERVGRGSARASGRNGGELGRAYLPEERGVNTFVGMENLS
jgi:hypothetical protein